MSGAIISPSSAADDAAVPNPAVPQRQDQSDVRPASLFSTPASYKGFAAGSCSGLAKVIVGHPFDTIKVRLQTSSQRQFSGPLDCLFQTLRNEGVRGLYKGATPPLVGWIALDSLLMGTLTLYRQLLLEKVFSNPRYNSGIPKEVLDQKPLPAVGHGIAGTMTGVTVSFLAAPIEHVKARLQIQYSADKSQRLYKGPIDCTRLILRSHGIRGLYRGLNATLIFRSFFFFWWSSYDIISRELKQRTNLSTPAVNFWAGGLSAQVYWLISYPADVVKQRIMADPMGGSHGDGTRMFHSWRDAAVAVGKEQGWRGYYRGFLPGFLRAFPANATALLVFEATMRAL